MAKFISLLKVQFLAFFGLNKTLKSKGKQKAGKLSGLISAAVLYILIFGFFAVTYSNIFAEALIFNGNIEGLLPLMLAMTAVISFFFSFYTATGALYGFKDYDFLASLPVPTSTVVLAKLAFMYLSDLFFALIIMIPSTVVYSGYAPLPGVVELIGLFLMTLVSPLLPMTLSVFFGGLVAFISSRFRRKNVAQIILWLLFFVACFCSGFFSGLNAEDMIDPTIAVSKVYFILPLAIGGMTNILYSLLFVASNVLPFVIVCFVVVKTYKKMNSLLSAKKTVKNYKYKVTKASGVKKALFIKEVKRFFSNATYVINCLMGSIMGVIFSVAIAILISIISEEAGASIADMIALYMPLAFSFCYMLSPSTACSISLEGSAFWILRTSPVEMTDLFNAKLKLNGVIAVIPAAVSALAFGVISGISAFATVILVALSATIAMLGGEIGLIMNILLPKFKWDNETVPVKQGGAVLLTLIIAFLYTAVQFLIVYFVPFAIEGVFILCLILAVILSIVSYAVIFYKGESLLAKKL